MTEINVLDSSIFNRIAAGEVVESPKSVVKELVENSIDAGADKITVQITNGGITSIRIIDNGKGIDAQNLPTAFLPHATSKVKNLQDLDNIATLGFRGEALPSIASVATISMTSRTLNSELGNIISFKNGKMCDLGEIGCPLGTTVVVENIFENIPARAKFLKKPTQEEADVSDLMIRFILANPKLSFKYITDDEIKYHSAGEGIESAIFAVYGPSTLDNLMQISNTTSHITMNGYVCKPSFSKHSRNYQTLIVNGRFVVNQELSYCIQQCYQEYLMKRQFPMFILYLNLALDMVDVNIQPNKMNVKFVDFSKVKGIVYKTIKDTIDKQCEVPKTITTFMNTFVPAESKFIGQNETNQQEQSEQIDCNKQQRLSNPKSKNRQNSSIKSEKTFLDSEKSYSVFTAFSLRDNNERFQNDNNSIAYDSSLSATKNASLLQNNNVKTDNLSNKSQSKTTTVIANATDSFYNGKDYKIVGKLFNTYITIEQGNVLLLIDQHAAHEKLIYDNLVKSINSKNVTAQDLLLPYVFEVSHTEKVYLSEIIPYLGELGFTIGTLSGLYFSISSIPTILSGINLKEFVSTLLANLENRSFRKSSEFIKEKLMQTACKAAVKGEMDLSKNEIELLIQQMQNSNVPLFCPHGRPIVIKLDRSDIEKWFKRIV